MIHELFRKFAAKVSVAMGSIWAFLIAAIIIIGWLVFGMFNSFSNEVQIPINTLTTIVTFLMVFLIQNSQNRESKATQLKLDELLRAQAKARNELIVAEEMPDEELERIDQEFKEKAKKSSDGFSEQ